MSLDDLDDADIATLRELLQLSGRAASDRRKALCIEINVNASNLSAIWTLPENDFAIELIDLLQKRRLEHSIEQLCQVLKSNFEGGQYAPNLDNILFKLNNNYNSELSKSTSITPVRRHLGEVIPHKPEYVISNPRLPGLSEQIHQFLPSGFSFRKIFIVSLTVTGTLIGLRFFGALEWMELKAFDNLMQIRPDEGIDKRLLIVKITDEDILAQDKRKEKGQGSLRDPSLNRMLEVLEQHQPKLIGLDLYRPFSADATIPGLLKQLGQKNIFAVCKVPTIDEQKNPQKEVAPPQEVSPENIGFSDFVSDLDNTVRRHLMVQDKVPGANCLAQQSFSLLLARRYLELELGKGSSYKDPIKLGENLQLDGVVFEALQPFTGGYQDVDNSGFQVLLNYRATGSGKIAQELTLEDVLNNRFQGEDVRDKIVLIGSDAEQQGPSDHWSTPYGTVNGTVVHAHMISQILSTVLDRRSLLGVLPQGIEILWIWGWSLTGGIFAYYWRSLKSLGIALGSGILVLYITCFTSLTVASLWIPLIPPILALVGTSSIVFYIISFSQVRPTNINHKL
ncbi:MAG: CHASE2 domain-containing protein [Rhizonema sp. PD38]|nr:CHASE2 domain-containing protein [Rhizonema sp. PD38]